MKCSICGEKKVTLIVPPDKPVQYCLECVLRDLSDNWKSSKEADHVIRIVQWLEKRGHSIPEAKLTIGKPIQITDEPFR